LGPVAVVRGFAVGSVYTFRMFSNFHFFGHTHWSLRYFILRAAGSVQLCLQSVSLF
jgi:hypothetical protein